MTEQTGNLSSAERAVSALGGLALSLITLRGRNPLLRAVAGLASGSLLARAYAGHCGIKAAVSKHTSLREGLSDQWRRMSGRGTPSTEGLPGSPAHAAKSSSVDESVEESFPASDPPASRLGDEPPVNADAKWETARAAEDGNGSDAAVPDPERPRSPAVS
jgi:hypothetical protein